MRRQIRRSLARMTVNIMVQIGSQVARQILGHPVKVLEHFPEGGRLIFNKLNTDHGARWPVDVWRKHDLSLLDFGSNAHTNEDSMLQTQKPMAFVTSRKFLF